MKVLRNLMIAMVASCMLVACSDDSGPDLTLNITDADTTYSVGDVINMTITATDDIGVSSFVVSSGDLGIQATETVTPNVSVTLDYTIGPLVENTPTGDFEIEVTAVDTDGNEQTESVDITVE